MKKPRRWNIESPSTGLRPSTRAPRRRIARDDASGMQQGYLANANGKKSGHASAPVTGTVELSWCFGVGWAEAAVARMPAKTADRVSFLSMVVSPASDAHTAFGVRVVHLLAAPARGQSAGR